MNEFRQIRISPICFQFVKLRLTEAPSVIISDSPLISAFWRSYSALIFILSLFFFHIHNQCRPYKAICNPNSVFLFVSGFNSQIYRMYISNFWNIFKSMFSFFSCCFWSPQARFFCFYCSKDRFLMNFKWVWSVSQNFDLQISATYVYKKYIRITVKLGAETCAPFMFWGVLTCSGLGDFVVTWGRVFFFKGCELI